jgi:hypothetical protein
LLIPNNYPESLTWFPDHVLTSNIIVSQSKEQLKVSPNGVLAPIIAPRTEQPLQYDSLDGGSACCRARYLRRTTQTQNTSKRTQTSVSRVGTESTTPVFERAKTVHALHLAATAIVEIRNFLLRNTSPPVRYDTLRGQWLFSYSRNVHFTKPETRARHWSRILRHMNPAYTFASYFLKFDFNAIPPAAKFD